MFVQLDKSRLFTIVKWLQLFEINNLELDYQRTFINIQIKFSL